MNKLKSISAILMLFLLGSCSRSLTYEYYPEIYVKESPEYAIVCEQAFDLALTKIMTYKAASVPSKPLAIVADLDETLINNTEYRHYLVANDLENNPARWKAWTQTSRATAIPGAVEFLRRVHSMGIHICYVSNRRNSERAATMRNLVSLGFPPVDSANFYLMLDEINNKPVENASNKKGRRDAIAQQYEVVLYLGDNLGDFIEISSSNAENRSRAAEMTREMRQKIVVLPNPMYGSWEFLNEKKNGKKLTAAEQRTRARQLYSSRLKQEIAQIISKKREGRKK